ncbi:MAG: CRISPR-associated endonuclease Cas1 [Bryobacteraceae bacterium]|nr:CRISPR-associated endonuclease Cas1 [Bryobacteraceae bacterium]
MATLYIDRRDVSLHIEHGSVAVRLNGELLQRVPLHLLERVVVSGDASLSTRLLQALAEAKIGVILVDPRNTSRYATVWGRLGSDASRRLEQLKRFNDESWRTAWAIRLLRAKFRGYRRVIGKAMSGHRVDEHALAAAADSIDRAIAMLDDPRRTDRNWLMGLEGAATASYFKAYQKLFAPSLQFHGRNRRPPRDPVNVLLSLTYTLLHHTAVREVLSAGLDPYLGYFHEPAFGRESLACDLVEPVRGSADEFVRRLFGDGVLRPEHFQRKGERCLLGKTGRQRYYLEFAAFSLRPQRMLRRVSRLLARSLSSKRADQPALEFENEEELIP